MLDNELEKGKKSLLAFLADHDFNQGRRIFTFPAETLQYSWARSLTVRTPLRQRII